MSVSLNVMRALAVHLRDRGISTDDFLREAGLSRALLEQPNAPPNHHDASRAVRAAYTLTGDEALGLHVGMSAPPQMLSVAGQLLMACPTIRAALGEMQRYTPLLLRDTELHLREQGDRAHVVFDAPPSLSSSRFASEFTLALVLRVGRLFVPSYTAPIEVRVRHARPDYAALYDEAFGCPTRFGAEHDEIVFSAHWLDAAQPFADEALRLLMRQRAEDLLMAQKLRESVGTRVRNALRNSNLSEIDADRVARCVGMNPRTLRVRLRQEGVALSAIVDELRLEISQRELLRADTPIKQIAERVGFSEVSAFHRAFKRWTGMTPAKYRAPGGFAQAV
jgi:AraC-like DNA-binding protein